MTSLQAAHLRKNMTDAERRLWYRLRRKKIGGVRFHRQAPLGPYIVDFACYPARLIIELDGGQHNDAIHQARDTTRSAWLEAGGFRVLRFWNNEVFENLEGVLETILTVVLERLPRDKESPPPRNQQS